MSVQTRIIKKYNTIMVKHQLGLNTLNINLMQLLSTLNLVWSSILRMTSIINLNIVTISNILNKLKLDKIVYKYIQVNITDLRHFNINNFYLFYIYLLLLLLFNNLFNCRHNSISRRAPLPSYYQRTSDFLILNEFNGIYLINNRIIIGRKGCRVMTALIIFNI